DYGATGVEIVVLERIGLDTGGVFKCEIMSEGNFQTEFKQANMTVMYLPEGAPRVTMAPDLQGQNISLGQTLKLNCTSPFGTPPPRLYWLINHQFVSVDVFMRRVEANEGSLVGKTPSRPIG
ncbi:hypothetical protein SK128_013070, partial [Halocaridina rubra]